MYLIASLLEMGDYYFVLCLFGVYMIVGDWELVKFFMRVGFEKQSQTIWRYFRPTGLL